MSLPFDKLLDVRGLNCPMPLVNARKEISKIETGQVLKVVATDRGSVADFRSWVKVAKNVELLGQETKSANGVELYVHFVKRTA